MVYENLSTERLILRPYQKSDANFMFELRSDPEFMKQMHRPIMTEVSEAEAFIQNVQDRIAAKTGYQSILELKSTHEPVGYAGIWRIDAANKIGEVGYGLHPKHTGKGYMTEALEAYLNFGFKTLNLNRIEAYMESENKASKSVVERLGFKEEGLLRAAAFFEETYRDLYVMSILSGEFVGPK